MKPERIEETEKQLGALLDAIPGPAILTQDGPRPFLRPLSIRKEFKS